MENNKLLVCTTPIPGLIIIRLHPHTDKRGSFRENLNVEKLKSLEVFSDFNIVQWNVSENLPRGVVRGLHAEPWNKYVNVLSGDAFGAFVDLRPGHERKLYTTHLDSDTAVFVPKGVANSYQTLTPNTMYGYLTDALWQSNINYLAINVADPDLNIRWTIPLDQSIISAKDKANPFLSSLGLSELNEKEITK